MRSFPKIFALGSHYIDEIFNGHVEVTEKLDGSQFIFGRVDNKVRVRSKGAELYFDNPEKMFAEGITYIESIQDRLPNNIIFYAEYFKKPKHNTLKYNNIPKNHLALFGVMSTTDKFLPEKLEFYASLLDIDCVPVFYKGNIKSTQEVLEFMESWSYLGGTKIEGVVIKNYQQPFLLGGQPIPVMAGKYVSEAFKEVHNKRWNREEKGKGKLDTFFDGFRTEARWNKAIQHLRDRGEIEYDPRDIGKLLKEIHQDIEEEEKENIKEWLWKEFGSQLKRRAGAGFAEWYKQKLLEDSFNV